MRDQQTLLNEIKDFLITNNAELLQFMYYPKIFGNIIVKVKFANIEHTFTLDRGEIYHNDNMLCDSTYHVQGKSDGFPKLLEVINKELFVSRGHKGTEECVLIVPT